MCACVGLSRNVENLRKGEVFAYVGRNQNMKELKLGGMSPLATPAWANQSTRPLQVGPQAL